MNSSRWGGLWRSVSRKPNGSSCGLDHSIFRPSCELSKSTIPAENACFGSSKLSKSQNPVFSLVEIFFSSSCDPTIWGCQFWIWVYPFHLLFARVHARESWNLVAFWCFLVHCCLVGALFWRHWTLRASGGNHHSRFPQRAAAKTSLQAPWQCHFPEVFWGVDDSFWKKTSALRSTESHEKLLDTSVNYNVIDQYVSSIQRVEIPKFLLFFLPILATNRDFQRFPLGSVCFQVWGLYSWT